MITSPPSGLARRTAISLAILLLLILTWIGLAVGSDALAQQLPELAIWIPLGLFGLIRWTVWLSRRIPAAMYRPITAPYTATAAIVVPVYQEDPAIFGLAIDSWVANSPDELIIVVDVTDEACRAIAERVAGAKVLVTDVPGKRDALAKGIRHATSEIVVLVDSDTVFAPDVLTRVLRPFADPQIGGVGTRQRVLAASTFWQRIAQIYLDIRYDVEAPATTVVGRAVSCLSGRTAAYRRAVVMPLLDEFLDERFLGKLCVTGEDKRLTSLVLKAGYDTYYQGDAVVWSTFAPDVATFVKQRVRWTRNTYRSDLRALWEGWIWQRPYLAFMLVDRLVSPYALLIGLAYFIVSALSGQWAAVIALGVWWILSRGLKLAPHFRREPRNLRLLPAYVVLTFAMAAVKVYALMTVHHHRWLTRNVEVVGGVVVRGDGRHHDRTALPVRTAGIALAAAFAIFVGGSFVAIGGFAFSREDTGRPEVSVDAPSEVDRVSPRRLVATATDRSGSELQYIWTLDGELLSTSAVAMLPADLESGTYRWTVHVRDEMGNTETVTGTVAVEGAPLAMPEPTPRPSASPGSESPAPSAPPTTAGGAGSGPLPSGSPLLPDTALAGAVR